MSEAGHPSGRIKRKPTSPEEIAAWRLFQQEIENSASMARTDVLRAYRHREEFDICEDFDFWARIAANHKLATLPEVLVRRRSPLACAPSPTAASQAWVARLACSSIAERLKDR
jgi:hypothetical protein